DAPSDLVMIYARAIAEHHGQGQAFPRRVRWLYAGPAALTVTRRGADSFELTSDRPWLAAPLDRMFRADLRFTVGQRFETDCMTAEITQVEQTAPHEALPTAVRFTLHRERPTCEIVLMAWTSEGFAPFELPELGQSTPLEPAVLF